MKSTVVVGLGKTGASCLRYLARQGIPAAATDTRSAPPGLAELGALAERIDLRLGAFDVSLLEGASQVLLSPGVSPQEPIVAEARSRGIEVLGDIELFARAAAAPVIGVTGTNGKSTVTSLVARMGEGAGLTVLAGGNLGKPALDLQAVLSGMEGAKALIQSVMEELRKSREQGSKGREEGTGNRGQG